MNLLRYRPVIAGFLLISAVLSSRAGAGAVHQSSARLAIVSPLSLIKTHDLLFGNIVAGSSPGTVIIDQNTGARSSTGGVTLFGGTYGPASFVGASHGLSLVFVHMPATPVTLTRVGGTQTLRVTNFAIQGGQIKLILNNQPFSFNIGGTLAVSANQAEGEYLGTFDLTMYYF